MKNLEDLIQARHRFSVHYLASRFTGDEAANKQRAAKIALAIMRQHPKRYVIPAVTSTQGIEAAFKPEAWYHPLLAFQATCQASIFVAEDIGPSWGVSLEFLHAVFVLHKPIFLVRYDDARDEAKLTHYVPRYRCPFVIAAKQRLGLVLDRRDTDGDGALR